MENVFKEIYEEAFYNELEKISSGRLVGSSTPYPPTSQYIKAHRDWGGEQDKYKTGVGVDATPAERRKKNVLRNRGVSISKAL